MKYGKKEYERSFMVDGEMLKQSATEIKSISDSYLIGTTLRLRKVETKNNVQFKLTQKKEAEPIRKGVKKINTIYLSSFEYEKLNELPAYNIEKKRYIIEINEQRIGLDLIQLGGEQIGIAELEFETELEMNAYKVPFNYIKEVTGDAGYSGFEIAKRYSGNI